MFATDTLVDHTFTEFPAGNSVALDTAKIGDISLDVKEMDGAIATSLPSRPESAFAPLV